MSKRNDKPWEKIFKDYKILKHDFEKKPYKIIAEKIKLSCQDFKTTGEKEVRILCKQDTRESRPKIFIEHDLFILPIRNGEYVIIKGEGYTDIPEIKKVEEVYTSQLDFILDTSKIGNSEMQHLDFAYASSLIRSFIDDKTLVLTIRGRKYTPKFDFNVNSYNIEVESVQTEVDAGYEGKEQIILVEAKNSKTTNTIIRQLYYPFRQWQSYTKKKVKTLFFEKNKNIYSLWQFEFTDFKDYNSIKLANSGKYKIIYDV